MDSMAIIMILVYLSFILFGLVIVLLSISVILKIVHVIKMPFKKDKPEPIDKNDVSYMTFLSNA